jgi:hypothetical protein
MQEFGAAMVRCMQEFGAAMVRCMQEFGVAMVRCMQGFGAAMVRCMQEFGAAMVRCMQGFGVAMAWSMKEIWCSHGAIHQYMQSSFAAMERCMQGFGCSCGAVHATSWVQPPGCACKDLGCSTAAATMHPKCIAEVGAAKTLCKQTFSTAIVRYLYLLAPCLC